ncbi:DUF1566 domain-containing protein [Parabacteroides segnis]
MLSFNLSSQTATTVMGYPVIDLSALEPLGAVLSSSEASARRTEMNNQTPSNDKFLSVGEAVSGVNGTWNEISQKYQVMRNNANSGNSLNWAAAYNFCKEYTGEGGKAGEWRLPTENELYMIWILHPQLIGIGGFSAFTTTNYWSATEQSETDAWGVYFFNGNTGFAGKFNMRVFRCVRDL